MMKEILRPAKVWDPGPRYAQGILTELGTVLFIAGQTALDQWGNIVGNGNIEVQTRQVLTNIEAILTLAGGRRNNLVATTSYVTDSRYLSGFYRTRREFFASTLPTSTTVLVNSLPRKEFLVQIEAIAVL
jgi:enamine deaminase RidA (YjgF/YER057c/UK114 family)